MDLSREVSRTQVLVEVSRLRLKTIYREKSAEAIVGNHKKEKVADGLNNVTVQTNVCTCGYPTADVGETYMSRKRENIGLTTGSGKERSTQSMSELLGKILDNRNMNEAYKKVCANKGAGGVDGMELEELDGYIRENWNSIREQIRERSYKPQPVRRVEIPKPNGSKRKLGIPTVMDRVIQQGIAQVISPMCEPLFSENSYGFRPNRSCEMAVREMLIFLNGGYEWIVDIDLEKFFDNVPQDKLMSLVHNIINDGDTESLIRKYLKAGVMVQGRYEKTDRGTPQGGLCKA